MRMIISRAGLRATQKGGHRRARRGSEVLELALLLFPLLLLTFGGMEFGFFFYVQHNAQAAAREGARAFVPLDNTADDAIAKATLYLENSKLNPADFSIDASLDGGNCVVTVEAPWSTFNLRLMRFIDASKMVGGTAVMKKEELPEP